MKVAVIGGGLAGCAVARSLKIAGAEPVIYDAADCLAAGSSGHDLGLYNPKFSAERTPQSDYYVAGFSLAARTFPYIEGVDCNPCGALHLICDERRERRFPKMLRSWNWEPEHMRIVSADEASEIAGVELSHDALYLADAGCVSPRKLCEYYAQGIEIKLNSSIEDLDALDADAVVLACGYGAKSFVDWLPISQVRGQLTDVSSTPYSQKLKTTLTYGGYVSPVSDAGTHVVGATFQRWLSHSDPLVEDNAENMKHLEGIVPRVAEDMKVVGHRAGVRTAVKDHFPVVGAVPGMDNVYVTTGHASHGIVSSLMAGYVLSDMIVGRPYSLSRETIQALSPQRFL